MRTFGAVKCAQCNRTQLGYSFKANKCLKCGQPIDYEKCRLPDEEELKWISALREQINQCKNCTFSETSQNEEEIPPICTLVDWNYQKCKESLFTQFKQKFEGREAFKVPDEII